VGTTGSATGDRKVTKGRRGGEVAKEVFRGGPLCKRVKGVVMSLFKHNSAAGRLDKKEEGTGTSGTIQIHSLLRGKKKKKKDNVETNERKQGFVNWGGVETPEGSRRVREAATNSPGGERKSCHKAG